jgi:hypothetical protein
MGLANTFHSECHLTEVSIRLYDSDRWLIVQELQLSRSRGKPVIRARIAPLGGTEMVSDIPTSLALFSYVPLSDGRPADGIAGRGANARQQARRLAFVAFD